MTIVELRPFVANRLQDMIGENLPMSSDDIQPRSFWYQWDCGEMHVSAGYEYFGGEKRDQGVWTLVVSAVIIDSSVKRQMFHMILDALLKFRIPVLVYTADKYQRAALDIAGFKYFKGDSYTEAGYLKVPE